jgi:hypothetical protein
MKFLLANIVSLRGFIQRLGERETERESQKIGKRY